MKYEYRICCFIDILGFRNHLDQTTDDSGEDIEGKIEDIYNIIQKIGEIPSKANEYLGKSKVITQFSDSIVISFHITERDQVFMVLIDFLHVALELANRGYLTRGGITWGKLMHNNSAIFGPALVKAYELESKKAFFPRILVDKDLFEVAKKFSTYGEDSSESLNKILTKDLDGEYYIDYISKASSEFDYPVADVYTYINRLKEIVSNGLKTNDSGVIKKMNWLKDKLNEYIEQIVESAKMVDNYDGDYEAPLVYRSIEKM